MSQSAQTMIFTPTQILNLANKTSDWLKINPSGKSISGNIFYNVVVKHDGLYYAPRIRIFKCPITKGAANPENFNFISNGKMNFSIRKSTAFVTKQGTIEEIGKALFVLINEVEKQLKKELSAKSIYPLKKTDFNSKMKGYEIVKKPILDQNGKQIVMSNGKKRFEEERTETDDPYISISIAIYDPVEKKGCKIYDASKPDSGSTPPFMEATLTQDFKTETGGVEKKEVPINYKNAYKFLTAGSKFNCLLNCNSICDTPKEGFSMQLNIFGGIIVKSEPPSKKADVSNQYSLDEYAAMAEDDSYEDVSV